MKMQNPLRNLLKITVALLAMWTLVLQTVFAHGSDAAMKSYMDPYGKIQAALASDDLTGAQTAAKTLPLDKDAKAIASSKSLEEARAAFKTMSMKAISMASDDEGYYTFKCPMVEGGYWIQTTTKTNNPYLGKSMPGCGKMLSREDAMKLAPDHDKMNMPGM